MRRFLLIPALALLTSTTFAQEPAPASPAPARPPLVLQTADWTVIRSLAGALETEAEPARPALEAGQCYLAQVEADGTLSVGIATGSDWLNLSAQPSALTGAFRTQLAQAKGLAMLLGSRMLSPQGMEPREIGGLVETLFDFPLQVDALELRMANWPDDPEQGLDLKLSLSPTAGSWFESFIAAMQPNQGGLRMLPTDEAQVVGMINLDFAKLLPRLGGVLTQLRTAGIADAETREAANTVLDEFHDSMRGTFSFTYQAGGELRWLMGLSDPQATRTAMADPMFATMLQESVGDMADVSVDAKAFSHREVTVLEQVTDPSDTRRDPGFSSDGTHTSFYAVAGDSMILSMLGGDADSLRRTIDQLLDDELGKREIPDGALLLIEMDVLEMAREMGLPPEAVEQEDLPTEVTVTLNRSGRRLILEIDSE